MSDNTQIINKINDIAQKLSETKSVITRSDLAYELRDLGVKADSPEISKWIWDAYQSTGNKAIAESFVNNSKSSTIVDEFKIPALIGSGENENVFEALDDKLKKSKDILSQLENLIDEKTKQKLVQTASGLIDNLSGSGAVTKIQAESRQIFEKYSQITGSYSQAKDAIRSLSTDFSELRQNTSSLYRKYAIALTDVFGDSIKASMPEMFDFEKIEFLDVDTMLKNVELAYNSIYGKCGELVGEISDNFSKTLSQSVSQIGMGKDKTVGLVIAGVNVISHYVKIGQHTSSLRKELVALKSSISQDVAAIRSDDVRLVEVFKNLNDVLIPKAEIFLKAAPKVFDTEFNALLDTIYSTPEAKQLRDKRNTLLEELRKLESRINDAKVNINYYTGHIADSKQVLDSLKDTYNQAKDSKPEPPSGVGNVLSLGTAKKNYNREIFEWSKNCEPLVSRYEDLAVDIKVDTEELESQKVQLAADTELFNALSAQERELSSRLSSLINSTQDVKIKAAQRLNDIIKLLKLAKDISESKLDERLLGVAKVEDFKEIELPESLSGAIKDFKEKITKDLKFSEQDAKDFAGKNATAEDVENIKTHGNELLNKGLEICNQLAELEAMNLNYSLSKEYYNKEFEKIKQEFQQNLQNIENKAAVLQDIARQINTTENSDILKQGLWKLIGNDNQEFSEKDWDDFINGNKVINI